jgi:hypothetical protein
MAGEPGEAESALKQKLKLTPNDPGNASAQKWKDAMWTVLSETTRADRGIQETIWRSFMAYIERLTAFQASTYVTCSCRNAVSSTYVGRRPRLVGGMYVWSDT